MAPLRELIDANGLEPPYTLRIGQQLSIPGGGASGVAVPPSAGEVSVTPLPPAGDTGAATPPEAPAAAAPTPLLNSPIEAPPATAPTEAAAEAAPAGAPAAAAVPTTTGPVAIVDPPQRAGAKFAWPVDGKVISNFGAKDGGLHNDGINIAAPRGTPVLAADNGVVAYAGSELQGFGKLILLKHADGFVTAYAHNDQVLVARGDVVQRGQIIARVGSTGDVSTPQLHFEVRQGSQPIDPRLELEPRQGAGGSG